MILATNYAPLIITIILSVYLVVFFIVTALVIKYNAPRGLIALSIAHLYGLILVLIIIFKPNGYADRSKRINCPNCGGLIGREFRICPYCHRQIAPNMMNPANYMNNQRHYPAPDVQPPGGQGYQNYRNYQNYQNYQSYQNPGRRY